MPLSLLTPLSKKRRPRMGGETFVYWTHEGRRGATKSCVRILTHAKHECMTNLWCVPSRIWNLHKQSLTAVTLLLAGFRIQTWGM